MVRGAVALHRRHSAQAEGYVAGRQKIGLMADLYKIGCQGQR